ncbi:hypothetical protein HN698_00005, partial [Candidatus Woesearchaeota archaeon]|nr:hypothetical protein [Candidatus Woesearchaeota archaeon]
ISLHGLSYPTQPQLLKNGVQCDDLDICNISSWDGSTLIANVSSFSNYTTSEAPEVCVNLSDASTYQSKVVNTSDGYYINDSLTLCQDTYTTNITMIRINNSGITIDCNGATLQGDSSGSSDYGFYESNIDDYVLRNCITRNFSYGFILYGDNIVLDNISAYDAGVYGLLLGGENTTLTNSRSQDSGTDGLRISSSVGGVLVNNTLINSSRYDFVTSECPTLVFENNTGSGNRPINYTNSQVTWRDFESSLIILCGANGSVLDNVTVRGVGNNMLSLRYADNVVIANSTISDCYNGIVPYVSNNFTIINNTIFNNSDVGIDLNNNHRNFSILQNNISNNDEGIFINGQPGNCSISGNTISNNTYGVKIWKAADSVLGCLISNNTISASTSRAFEIYTLGQNISNYQIIDNVIYAASNDGINFVETSSYYITDNIISGNTIHNADSAIYLDRDTINNVFDNNTIYNAANYAVYFYASGGDPIGNTFNNLTIYQDDNFIYTSTALSGENNFTNLNICYNSSGLGCITWPSLNISSADLDNTNLKLAQDFVSLNSSDTGATQFNRSANITINTSTCEIDYFIASGFPQTRADIISSETIFTPSYSTCANNISTFSVDSFSGYTVQEESCVDLNNESTYYGRVVNSSGVFYVNDDVTLCPGTYNTTGDLIDINASSITLDCNGATLMGDGAGSDTGVDISVKSNVNILNCIITNFSKGLEIYVGSGNISNNTIHENTVLDIDLSVNSGGGCVHSIYNNTGSGGRDILYANSQVTWSNQVASQIILCNADGSSLTNMTVSGSDTLDNNELYSKFSDNLSIVNSTSSGNYRGAYLRQGDEITVTGSNFSNNDGYGLYIYLSNNITVDQNNIFNNSDGLHARYSTNLTVTANTISQNTNSINAPIDVSNSLIAHNFFSGASGNEIATDGGYNNQFINNSFSSAGLAFWFTDSYNNTLVDNTLTDVSYGFYFRGITNNNTINNTIISGVTEYVALTFYQYAGEYPVRNIFNNLTIYGETDFMLTSAVLPSENNFTDLKICLNSLELGCIEWPSLNITFAELDNNNLILNQSFVSLDSSNASAAQFSQPANITINTSTCTIDYYNASGFPENRTEVLASGTQFTPSYTSCANNISTFSVDSFSGYTVFLSDLLDPEVNLVSPANETATGDSLQTFTCNIIDNRAIGNLSLYLWNQSNSLIYNPTTTLTGISNETSFLYDLPTEGNYTWNCLGSDAAGNAVWSEQNNYTISLTKSYIDNCTTLSSEGVYYLNASVNSTGTCFTITSNNVTIDCDGYTINYSTSGAGFGITSDNYDNLEARSCIITSTGFSADDSIYIANANNITLRSNTINVTTSNVATAILFSSTTNSLITGNNLFSFAEDVVELTGSSTGNTLSNNVIIATGLYNDAGVSILAASNTLTDNNITVTAAGSTNNPSAIEVQSGTNTFNGNRITTYNDDIYGIYFANGAADNNDLNNNVILTNGSNSFGIYLPYYNANNDFVGNNVTTSGQYAYGVFLDDNSDSNQFNTTTIITSGDYGHGIYVNNSDSNEFFSNTIIMNGRFSDGLHARFGADSNTIQGNNITTYNTSSGSNGINLYASGLGTGIQGNSILDNDITTYGPSTDGIYIGRTKGNAIENNRITTFGVHSNAMYIAIADPHNISYNNFTPNSGIGVRVQGVSSLYYNHSLPITNNVHGLPLLYNTSLENQIIFENQDLSSTYGQITCASCTNVSYSNLTLAGAGIALFSSSYSDVSDITGTVVSNGLYLYDSINVTLNSLDISMTGQNAYGVYLVSSDNNSLINTNVLADGGAIKSSASDANTLTLNNSYGQISWTKNDLTTDQNISPSTTFLESNNLGLLDHAGLANLNSFATIQIRQLSSGLSPYLLKNGVRCDNTSACNISSYANGVLTAEVSSFSNYTTQNVVDCGIVASDYTLNQSISSAGTCLNVTASDITIDCAGNSITYGTSSGANKYGVYVGNYNNVTIRNCQITESDQGNEPTRYAVYYNAAVLQLSGTITNNTISTVWGAGIYLYGHDSLNISTNTISCTGSCVGLYLKFGSNNSEIADNSITSTNWYGVEIEGSSAGNTFRNNDISGGSKAIFDFTGGQNNLVYSNAYGEITWTDTSFLNEMDIDADIGLGTNLYIGENIVALNTTAFSELGINSSANITMRQLELTDVSAIKRLDNYSTSAAYVQANGADCLGGTCVNLSFDNATKVLVFNTTSFSSFSAEGSATPDTTDPVINLIGPLNATPYENLDHTFSCNITDNIGVENLTLYIWNGSNLIYNTTNTTITGTQNESSFPYTLPTAINYTWNCLGFDNSTNGDWSQQGNYTLEIVEITAIDAPTALSITNINDSALYLNWTNVTDADSYTVYYSTNVSQILNLNTSNLGDAVTNVTGISILNWTDTSSGSVTERYYRVAAIRLSNDNVTNSTVGKYDIEVVEATGIPGSDVDLNLISIPLIPNDYSINTIINQSSNSDLIYRYNTDTQNYQSTQFFAGFGWFGDFDEFEPGVGYAFKPVAASYNFTVLGTVPAGNLTVTVKNATGIPGSGIDLNLIGWHSPIAKCDLGSFITGASDNDIIYRYNTQTQNYQSTQYFEGFGWFGDFDCLESGVAYEFKPVSSDYDYSYERT